ncbi:MAG TPA: hypothetical protein VFA68_07365 [Terriglobales bacterium]|nr:hypothetical protein [Terriglobales bacterium]
MSGSLMRRLMLLLLLGVGLGSVAWGQSVSESNRDVNFRVSRARLVRTDWRWDPDDDRNYRTDRWYREHGYYNNGWYNPYYGNNGWYHGYRGDGDHDRDDRGWWRRHHRDRDDRWRRNDHDWDDRWRRNDHDRDDRWRRNHHDWDDRHRHHDRDRD